MKAFETPIVEVVMFAIEDVITASSTEQGGDVLPPTDED